MNTHPHTKWPSDKADSHHSHLDTLSNLQEPQVCSINILSAHDRTCGSCLIREVGCVGVLVCVFVCLVVTLMSAAKSMTASATHPAATNRTAAPSIMAVSSPFLNTDRPSSTPLLTPHSTYSPRLHYPFLALQYYTHKSKCLLLC